MRVQQRQRCEGGETIPIGSDQFREFVVLNGNDFLGQIAVAAIPEWVDRHHFHVDRLGVHGFEALLDYKIRFLAVVDGRREARCLIPE